MLMLCQSISQHNASPSHVFPYMPRSETTAPESSAAPASGSSAERSLRLLALLAPMHRDIVTR